MKQTKLWIASLVIWTSLMVPLHLSSAAVPVAPSMTVEALKSKPQEPDSTLSAPSFKEAVNQWISHIGLEPGYEEWRQASWSGYALGPGTHGWLVLIQSGDKDIGYMVIHAADPHNPNQYRLTEYGNGGKPLFSLQVLHQSLAQIELIHTSYEAERWYIDPLHAVWKVSSGDQLYFLDAKTGELLPFHTDSFFIDSPDSMKTVVTTLNPEHTIKESLRLPAFDPYEKLPWVQGSPSFFASFAELHTELQQRKLTFTAELYGSKMLVPLAVTGYQQWSNDEVFLSLEQDGQRSVPYSVITRLGKLFR